MAVMAGDHVLAGRAAIDIAELVELPFLTDNSTHQPWHDYWLAMEHRSDPNARIAGEFASNDEWLEALRLGRGVSLCPASVGRYYGRPGLAFVPVMGMPPSICGIAWWRDRPSALIDDFVAVALQVAADGLRTGNVELASSA
jgi:DNA-binding transcriptional LysR family regulator